MLTTRTALLSIGSNLGDRARNLRAAVEALGRFAHVRAVSPFYETVPMYVDDQDRFLNAALLIDTGLGPEALLDAVKRIEARLGRVPSTRNGPRCIDIDIVYLDQISHASERLTLPHPRWAERPFVLAPAADIAADWIDPESGRTVAQMLAALGPIDDMVCRRDEAA